MGQALVSGNISAVPYRRDMVVELLDVRFQ